MRELFLDEGIEYYAVLDINDVIQTYPELIEREGFTPRSLVVYLVPYYVSGAVNLSTYATSLDYHICITEINLRLAERLKQLYPEAKMKGYGDHSPIDEVDAAVKAGLGVRGKNHLLINEKFGSYVFIGEMITDIEADKLGTTPLSSPKSCIDCGRCAEVCPTGTLRCGAPCLSAITQRKGELTETEAEIMRSVGTAWGCDLCQTVCPYNESPKQTPIAFFHRERVTKLTQDIVNSYSREELRRRAFGWRGRAVLLRNLGILSDTDESEN